MMAFLMASGAAQAREMSTDRPDKTESPHTLDKGRYMMEMSFIDYTHNKDEDGVKSNAYSVAPLNMKAGLADNIDLQIVAEPFITQQTKADGETDRVSGFGSLQTRLKVNLWGNDGGKTAGAIMPFVQLPIKTDINDTKTQGGVIVPIAFELPWGWGMGYMAEFDVNQDSGSEHYHMDYINSVTFDHQIIGNLDGYVEFYSNNSQEKGVGWAATVDTGVTYALTEDIQLDAGVNIGVTRAADDFNPFCGVSIRY